MKAASKNRDDVGSSEIRSALPAILVAVFVLVTFAFWFAEPVEDGDLFFHMAYAKQMLAYHTLVPDHTIYTFTPADNTAIYCAWIGELSLLGLFRAGGYGLLFVVRYAVIGLLLVLVAISAHRHGQLRNPLVGLGLLLAILMSSAGAHVKPELFSFGLMTLTTFLWFDIKTRPGPSWRAYGFPLLMLVWVNTHGAFIFGLAFLLLAAAGELLDYFTGREGALPLGSLRHFLLATFLSFVAMLATPYGLAYPRVLAAMVLGNDPMLKHVAAYTPIFDIVTANLSFVHFLWAGIGLLAYLLFRADSIPPSVVLVNLGFAMLYTFFGRTTYFWAPILAFSVLLLISRSAAFRTGTPRFAGLVAVALAAYMSGRAVWESVTSVPPELFLGFGVGPENTVVEAEFVKRFVPGTRVGCSYDAGSYLLWELHPDRKVLIDNRYFPFRSWIQEYWELEGGAAFDAFFEKYPCDLFVVNHSKGKLVSSFMKSPRWRPAFFGPAGAVFIPAEKRLPAESESFAPDRFDGIRNVTAGGIVFQFALRAGRPDLAERILARLQHLATGAEEHRIVNGLSRYYDAIQAVNRREYEKALPLLAELKDSALVSVRNWETKKLFREGKLAEALQQARLALATDPTEPHALFNVAILSWKLGGDPRAELQAFLQRANASPDLAPAVAAARTILGGSYTGVFVIAPPEPGTTQPGVR